MTSFALYSDGGARGNPGPAAVGFHLTKDGTPLSWGSAHLGDTTNNVAEYMGAVFALQTVAPHLDGLPCSITLHMDSELVVKQCRGEYKVKQSHLRQLLAVVQASAQLLVQRGAQVEFVHIPRSKNARADQLVNSCLDEHSRSSS